ncbi:MAG: chromosome partition protein Smc [Candidatus Poribacteria bacterium]|nr:MAG: chromosome partition protein Smc [Candidatus Poribacteria bacterium]
MKLKEIRISGFKSFAEPVTLTVEEGITAIVGPNGCGKSNISDAIRWALGEQSSRSLRCSKMEDVLFNGGSEGKPAKAAEVTLVLSNEDGALPIDSPTVSVTRLLTAEGESRYLLNGAQCRLRDIQELFLDTGIGRNAYSLMEQGNIDLILNARPEERRYLFDEVAGINKFKFRKKAALKKLEETEQNLLRIQDVIGELERETEALREQAEKAKAFRERQEELRRFELTIARRRWDEVRRERESLEQELKTAAETIHRLTEQLQAVEATREELLARRSRLEEEIQGAQNQIHKLETEIERTESTIALLKERQSGLFEQRESRQVQIQALQEQIARLAEQAEAKRRERDQLQVALQLDESRLRGRQRVLEELSHQAQEAVDQVERLKARLIELMDEAARSESALTSVENRSQHSASQRERLAVAYQKQQRERSQLEFQRDEVRRRLKGTEGERTAAQARLRELEGQIAAALESLRKLEAEVRGHQDALATAAHRARSLEELQKSYEGFYTGVRAVLRYSQERPEELPGIHGVVAELIRVEPEYQTAIEIALGSSIQNVVTETAEDAKRAIEFLKRHRAGRVTFLPLDILYSRNRMDEELLRYHGVIGWAPDLVDTDRRYQTVVEYLIGNVVVVETLDDAIQISRRERTRMRLVTLEGEVVNPGGAMTGGTATGRAGGFLQRPREIQELKAQVEQLSALLQKKEERRKQLETALQDHEAERARLRETIQRFQIEEAAAKKDLEQVEVQLRRADEELRLLEQELTLLEDESGGLSQEREELQRRIETIRKERQQVERRIQNLEEQRNSALRKKEEVEGSLTEMRVELAGRRQQIEGLAGTIASLEEARREAERQLELHRQAVENHAALVQELEQKIAEAQHSFLLLEQKRFEHHERLIRLEAEREQLLADLSQAERESRQLRREAEKLSKHRHHLDVKLTQLRMHEQSLAERILEKYRVPIESVEPDPTLPEEGAEERVQQLRGQLEAMGAVNLMAIEEYENHRKRLEFLQAEHRDLEAGRRRLQEAIRKIDETSRERFLSTFEQIRENFQRVFVRLFGGGETELRLTDEEDVLESGIEIIARPPGKRPQSISLLSGGERSLVAIALLFAVFEIRPSPFCVLDEVDAALDEANVLRFTNLIENYDQHTQFLIITHNKRTMEKADVLYGVTMERAGVSKVVSVRFAESAA